MKTALYPGSFDPFTIAHERIVLDALSLFDKVVIGVGTNVAKNSLLSIEKRKALIEKVFDGQKARVEVITYNSLTVDVCKDLGISHIVRGVRNYGDFEFESNIAAVNKMLNKEILTIYLTCEPELKAVSSSAVREILRFGGDPTPMLPTGITTSMIF